MKIRNFRIQVKDYITFGDKDSKEYLKELRHKLQEVFDDFEMEIMVLEEIQDVNKHQF